MKSFLYHLQLNIDFHGLPFYKMLMELLGWDVIFENSDVAGFTSGKNGDLWFANCADKKLSNYDHLGVNHIAIRVEQLENVDEVVAFLKKHRIEALFETPRHRPEFSSSDKETYYQVMFKTADNLLFEVVYIGSR